MRRYQASLSGVAIRKGRRSAHVVLLNGTRRVENLRTRSKIRAPQVAGARMMVPPVQMCCECAQCAAAIHLESQSPETLLRAAARERLPRRLAPAILAISNDAAPGRQWLQKMFFPEKAAPKHPPARHRRLRFGFAREARRQMRGYTRCSSRARRVFAIPPLPRPALRQFQERVRPNPCRTKATELLASASCAASTTKHKTSSQSDSQKHVQSAARDVIIAGPRKIWLSKKGTDFPQ